MPGGNAGNGVRGVAAGVLTDRSVADHGAEPFLWHTGNSEFEKLSKNGHGTWAESVEMGRTRYTEVYLWGFRPSRKTAEDPIHEATTSTSEKEHTAETSSCK